jgi:hypothetical protein
MLGFIDFLMFYIGVGEMRIAYKIIVVKPGWKG